MEQVRELFASARDWLDSKGFVAWIATMVLGFLIFPPIGLVLLGYLLWSGRMGCCGGRKRWGRRGMRGDGERTGNTAFDAYREETLRRLEEEREAFTSFLDRLRKAKDEAEFEQFMAERRAGGGTPARGPNDGPQGAPGGFPQPA